jgi:hypothetical protein
MKKALTFIRDFYISGIWDSFGKAIANLIISVIFSGIFFQNLIPEENVRGFWKYFDYLFGSISLLSTILSFFAIVFNGIRHIIESVFG